MVWRAIEVGSIPTGCTKFLWAVSDNGSTGALHVSGKSSILLRSTKFMDSSVLGTSWFAKPIYSEMGISSILILSSKILGYLQQTKIFHFLAVKSKQYPVLHCGHSGDRSVS